MSVKDLQSTIDERTNNFNIDDRLAIINLIHFGEHNHPHQGNAANRQLAANEMRARIRENPMSSFIYPNVKFYIWTAFLKLLHFLTLN